MSHDENQFDPTANVNVDVVASGHYDDSDLPKYFLLPTDLPPEAMKALLEQLEAAQADPAITFQAMSVKEEGEPGPDGVAPVPLDQVTSEQLAQWVSEAREREGINVAPEEIIDLYAQSGVMTAQAVGDPVVTAQAVAPSYMPSGLRIDWLDPTVNVSIQVVRNKDLKIYDVVTKTFVAESSLVNKGIIPLGRPFAGTIRAAYQEYMLATTATVFQDGVYLLFYFDSSNNTLLDACSFSVYQGVPFQSPLPPANIFPSAVDNAIRLLGADLTKHKIPNSPGLALNKLLAPTA